MSNKLNAAEKAKIVAAYLTYKTTWEAAQSLQMGVHAYRRALQHPDIREQIRDALMHVVDDAMQTLAKAASEAANNLVEALHNGTMMHPQRLKMLEFVLARAVDFSKLRLLETEIETLRDEIANAKNAQRAKKTKKATPRATD